MKNLRRVVWWKGMFLTPQHFQAQEKFFADNGQFRFTNSNYANWGVTLLSLDEPALTNGKVALNKAQGVLPDGLVFDIGDIDEAPLGRPFREHFKPPTALDIILRSQSSGKGKNVTPLAASKSDDAPPTANTRLNVLLWH